MHVLIFKVGHLLVLHPVDDDKLTCAFLSVSVGLGFQGEQDLVALGVQFAVHILEVISENG